VIKGERTEQHDDLAKAALVAELETTGHATLDMPQSITGHAVRGGIVIGSAQLVRIGVQFLSVIVLSRLLLPEDFGLVASVTPLIGFVSMFQDLGYGQAIIQRRDITQEQTSSVFWTTAALGLSCALIAILASPAVAWFFHDRRLLPITIAASVPLLLGSLMSVPVDCSTDASISVGWRCQTLLALSPAWHAQSLLHTLARDIGR